ncbi:MAG: tRNA (N(6)-L-threonylcarbamoyladenosine(37)-C(2))-methylthiotransferase MtaB [Clostridiales bacterium]|nr:tRNA (N(6)-L-threonylcarbamoyladenosine(37)-C(2))-methylthiotransferase MtaB [Clostridiales bacterium]MCI2160901.1 tRNA (N(6)-L-threonylcarbamoyladenosine(37)-C(2))-methylthiotransferase MtaB [Oscillospiraceae bacterium]MCI1961972.1 tRNA (N(6)-L-threonylcarbamoyladenosine(37)-C(2))-methylthiotransferase MtaB [Clostridiales bacterium]MCI2022295.1 tRNA (N(6)-L-threonylcarbamoyladenosine(37)-C(2))-methylthiotransferase MtaB [Clostridiales bacterium]MCI2026692.1 tRNA (N(6)-L-threonylcarbamoylade
MNITAITLGCKVNQYETEAMLSMAENSGFTVCEGDCADIILINSCTVTATSDHKVRQTLHRVRRKNPTSIIILTGCMPQAFPEKAAALDDADIILGNSNRNSLIPHIHDFLTHRERIIDIEPHGKSFESMQVTEFHEHTRAFVKIEDGCNRFCSYCIIPYARGRVRSKPLSELKEELSGLAENGYREIVLTGINLPAYGQDIGATLCDAIDTACEISKIHRVRLGSLEPEQLTPPVIARMAAQKKLCPQFHLSLQSGCDKTLRRMNRHYTTDEYREIVQNLRAAFPNAAITTDIMVGFSGETEEEFQKNLAFEQEIAFSKVHVFPYSRRPGTRAYEMPEQVSNAEKERRSAAMIAAAHKTQQAFLKAQVGLCEEVLFERSCAKNVYEGYTPNYTLVRAVSSDDLSGKLLMTEILTAESGFCTGKIRI